jgi:excisionase family DNA binding protein
MTALGDRLRSLVDALPDGGSVTLDKAALMALVASESDEAGQGGDLSTGQVAERLGRSENTVRRLIVGGHLDAYRVGKTWRVTQAAFDAFRRGPRLEARAADLSAWRRILPRREAS